MTAYPVQASYTPEGAAQEIKAVMEPMSSDFPNEQMWFGMELDEAVTASPTPNRINRDTAAHMLDAVAFMRSSAVKNIKQKHMASYNRVGPRDWRLTSLHRLDPFTKMKL